MGFAFDQIPLHARIIAVANAYDSMIMPRPPNQAISHEDATRRLKELAGTKFDPEVVAAFVARPGFDIAPSSADVLEPAFA
jgi:putative two-component system response regulator